MVLTRSKSRTAKRGSMVVKFVSSRTATAQVDDGIRPSTAPQCVFDSPFIRSDLPRDSSPIAQAAPYNPILDGKAGKLNLRLLNLDGDWVR